MRGPVIVLERQQSLGPDAYRPLMSENQDPQDIDILRRMASKIFPAAEKRGRACISPRDGDPTTQLYQADGSVRAEFFGRKGGDGRWMKLWTVENRPVHGLKDL